MVFHWIEVQGASHDGEGLVVLPGPPMSRYRGILSTLHFENLRDALEDFDLLRPLFVPSYCAGF